MGLVYVTCFCRRGDRLLMLHRRRPPNRGLWNGVGGKLEPGERPLACVHREVWEETGIALAAAARVTFGGLVTWNLGADPAAPSTGMYAFVAELPPDWPLWDGDREVAEGRLRWLPLARVCDPANDRVVSNIPRFLPTMLAGGAPREYRCAYDGERLVDVTAYPLAGDERRLSDT
jgi:8-oxo-dGTP diphosphatase